MRKLDNILERTSAAIGVSRATLSIIRTENDVHSRSIESESYVQGRQKSDY